MNFNFKNIIFGSFLLLSLGLTSLCWIGIHKALDNSYFKLKKESCFIIEIFEDKSPLLFPINDVTYKSFAKLLEQYYEELKRNTDQNLINDQEIDNLQLWKKNAIFFIVIPNEKPSSNLLLHVTRMNIEQENNVIGKSYLIRWGSIPDNIVSLFESYYE